MYEHGWFQIAFERDLTQTITPLHLYGRRLMAIKREDGSVSIFDANCPHRGTDLTVAGKLSAGDKTIKCGFHGHRIGLGACADVELCVREYKTIVFGGMVFIRLSDREGDPELLPALETLAAEHNIVAGFTLEMKTALEVISENGWDAAHFKSVHALPSTPRMTSSDGTSGPLISEGGFVIPRTDWYGDKSRGELRSRFRAIAYSPGLVIADLSGNPPFNYTVITGAISHGDPRQCTIRVSVAIPKTVTFGERFTESLLTVSKRGLEEDRVIWEALDLEAPSKLLPGDELFEVFHTFCTRFGTPTDRRLERT